MAKKWKAIMQVAATYIGTVVGAGFASGQEILQFFTLYSGIGIISICISTFLFIWLGSKIMRISHEKGCYSYQELNVHLFGKKWSWLVNGLTLIILFGTTGVMLSGTGSIFEEQLGLPNQVGIIITILLSLLTMYRGMSGVIWVNSLVVPMMLLFTAILGFHLLQYGVAGTHTLQVENWEWAYSPLLYAGFNLAMAQAVLVPLGKDIQDSSILRWGGICGGVGLGTMLMVNDLSLLSHLQGVQGLDIPMAYVISEFGGPVVLLFTIIVFGEIFTTIIGNVFGLVRQAHSIFNMNESLAAIMILLGSFIVSQWGFKSLVTFLYPAFGGLGLLFMLRLMMYRKKATMK